MNTRPTYNDPKVREAMAVYICSQLCKWLDSHGEQYDKDEIYNDVVKLARYCSMSEDGYYLCSKIESDFGYQPDTQLVNMLDDLQTHSMSALDSIVADWVKENNIVPQFSLNQKVKTDTDYTGTIFEIDCIHGKYKIGTTPARLRIVPFERVTLAE